MKKRFAFLFVVLASVQIAASAQTPLKTPTPEKPNKAALQTEREIREFYDAYADDLRLARREAIAERYDTRGFYSLGNGSKSLISFEVNKQRYLTGWTPPQSFAWRDLSIEVVSPDAAAVTSLFEWKGATGTTATLSYTALLVKRAGKWRIRIEDESISPVGYTIKPLSGDRKGGPVKYTLTAQPGASLAAHRHSAEMRIKILSGRKFILMGDLDNAKVQVFEAGSSFAIPANTWHVEWWEAETVEEIDIIAPWTTERANPSTPRTP
jgi:quercetin dioxygenase-like cupin family protein